MPNNHTPTATDALRSWLIHAGFGLTRRSAGLAALDSFDAALRGDISDTSTIPRADLSARVLDALHSRPGGLTLLELADHIAAVLLDDHRSLSASSALSSDRDRSSGTPENVLRDPHAAAVAAVLAEITDPIHAGGCYYRHQQGEVDECNSCTAHKIETSLADALAGVIAAKQAEALREFAESCDETCRTAYTNDARHFAAAYGRRARDHADRIEAER